MPKRYGAQAVNNLLWRQEQKYNGGQLCVVGSGDYGANDDFGIMSTH